MAQYGSGQPSMAQRGSGHKTILLFLQLLTLMTSCIVISAVDETGQLKSLTGGQASCRAAGHVQIAAGIRLPARVVMCAHSARDYAALVSHSPHSILWHCVVVTCSWYLINFALYFSALNFISCSSFRGQSVIVAVQKVPSVKLAPRSHVDVSFILLQFADTSDLPPCTARSFVSGIPCVRFPEYSLHI